MKKIRLLLVLVSLFIGFNTYADDKVYILYRDSNGEWVTSTFDPYLIPRWTGYVGFYIVPENEDPYIIDAMPDIGVKKRTLGEFKGDGEEVMVVDPELTPEQTD